MSNGADKAGSPTLRAILSPAVIVIAALTVGAALISLPLAIPGAVLWAITVYFLSRRYAAGGRVIRPDIRTFPPTVQRDLSVVREALDQIRQSARSAPRDQRVMFADILREARDAELSVERLAAAAASLHEYLAQTVDDNSQPERRQQLMDTLERYHTTMQGLAASVQNLRASMAMTQAGQVLDYDATDSPLRQMDEMKASVEALEEVMASSVIVQE